jgi:hypothetical protein
MTSVTQDERETLEKEEKSLDEKLKKFPLKSEEEKSKESVDLLHAYNEIKDATQKVLGALALREEITIKQMHQKFDLPLDS